MLTLLLCLLSVQAPDSTRARLVGTVADSTGAPVAQAQVRVDTLSWHEVSPTGTYALEVSPGSHVLFARALGFDSAEVPVAVSRGETIHIDLHLERVTILSGVHVVAGATRPSGVDERTGFDARRATGAGGFFLDSAAVAGRRASRTSDLLRSIPGVILHPVTNDLGTTEYVLVMRGTTTVRSEVCPIEYYLDGHPFPQDDNIDRLIRPAQIAAIEVYRGTSDVPLQFRGPTSRCGVIVIWTKR